MNYHESKQYGSISDSSFHIVCRKGHKGSKAEERVDNNYCDLWEKGRVQTINDNISCCIGQMKKLLQNAMSIQDSYIFEQ